MSSLAATHPAITLCLLQVAMAQNLGLASFKSTTTASWTATAGPLSLWVVMCESTHEPGAWTLSDAASGSLIAAFFGSLQVAVARGGSWSDHANQLSL